MADRNPMDRDSPGHAWMPTVVSVRPAGTGAVASVGDLIAVLAHDERRLRRRAIATDDGTKVLVNFAAATTLHPGDALVLSDRRTVTILAADEDLYQIRAESPVHLTELAWHIGNRHLAAEIRSDSIFILEDHVLRPMLEGLGARLEAVKRPFSPTRGAYSGHHGEADRVHPHEHN